ncbi:MAG: alanine racemase [Bacillota bacterium]
MTHLRPAFVEVNLDNLYHNVDLLLKKTGTALCAVVKADGYGHGAIQVASVALAAGACRLAVAILDEAVALRRAGFDCPIMILGYTPPEDSGIVVEHELEQTVYTREQAAALSRAAVVLGKRARIHLKVDTGMGRLGVRPDSDGVALAAAISRFPAVDMVGCFTHLADADAEDPGYTRMQLERFQGFREALLSENIPVQIFHAANSAGAILYPESRLDMVRVGLAMYGLFPSDRLVGEIDLLPAMSVKARVAHVKLVPRGESISYGRTYTTDCDQFIATIPLGYADGYPRLLSNRGEVLIQGRLAPVVGRVCMDQFMVRVWEGVKAGDEVVIIGEQAGARISAEDLSRQWGTINYEVVCAFSRRLPRLYVGGGKVKQAVSSRR